MVFLRKYCRFVFFLSLLVFSCKDYLSLYTSKSGPHQRPKGHQSSMVRFSHALQFNSAFWVSEGNAHYPVNVQLHLNCLSRSHRKRNWWGGKNPKKQQTLVCLKPRGINHRTTQLLIVLHIFFSSCDFLTEWRVNLSAVKMYTHLCVHALR